MWEGKRCLPVPRLVWSPGPMAEDEALSPRALEGKFKHLRVYSKTLPVRSDSQTGWREDPAKSRERATAETGRGYVEREGGSRPQEERRTRVWPHGATTQHLPPCRARLRPKFIKPGQSRRLRGAPQAAAAVAACSRQPALPAKHGAVGHANPAGLQRSNCVWRRHDSCRQVAGLHTTIC